MDKDTKDQELKQFLQNLLDKTKNDKIKWVKEKEGSYFTDEIPSHKILIKKTTWANKDAFILTIEETKEKGRKGRIPQIDSEHPEIKLCAELYKEVEKNAEKNKESVIKKMLQDAIEKLNQI